MFKLQNKGNFRVAQLLEFSKHIHSSMTVWLHKMSKAVTINIHLQSLKTVSWKTEYSFSDTRIYNLPHYLQHWVCNDLVKISFISLGFSAITYSTPDAWSSSPNFQYHYFQIKTSIQVFELLIKSVMNAWNISRMQWHLCDPKGWQVTYHFASSVLGRNQMWNMPSTTLNQLNLRGAEVDQPLTVCTVLHGDKIPAHEQV